MVILKYVEDICGQALMDSRCARVLSSHEDYTLDNAPLIRSWIIVNASARPPRLAGLPNVGTCDYRYTHILVRYIDTVICLLHTQ